MLSNQEWKEINEYSSKYLIGENGDVYNVDRNRLVSTCMDNRKRYLTVSLYKEGKLKTFRPHKLVGIHFVPNPRNLTEINHKDGNKLNNHHSNLEWASPRENSCHRSLSNKKKTSKYVGVCFHRNAWIATITINSKHKYIGQFKTEEEAYQARCKFEKENGIVNKYL